MPEDEALLRDALERVARAQPALRRRRPGPLLPVPPPPAVEPVAGLLDGMGAEARQAVGVQPAAPGRPPTRAIRSCSADPAQLAADPLRDHAGRRHPDAARHRRPAGRHAGPSAQPAAVRSGVGAGGRGLRRPAAAGQLPPDGGHALALRRPAGGLGGHRPLLDGGLRRLHGPLRPGQLHGQGDLRRRRVRGGDRRDLPREPYPQPRPDRGELRPVRPAQRHRAVRRLPRPLSRLRPPRAPLGPRRLAAPALAGPRACRRPRARRRIRCRRWSAGSCSTTSAAAWCLRPWSCCWSWAGRSCRARPGSGRRRPWPCWPCRSCNGCSAPLVGCVADRLAGGVRSWRDSVPAMGGPGPAGDRLPGRPGLARCATRWRVPWCGCSSRGASCWSGRPPRRPSSGWARAWRDFVVGHVAGRRLWPSRSPRWSRSLRPAALWAAGAVLAAWLLSPLVAFWVSRPKRSAELRPDRGRAAGACGGSPGRPGTSSRPSSATTTTGSPRTTSRRSPTAGSPTAPRRPTRACCCSRPWPHTTWAIIGLGTLVERLEKTFDTLERLERHWGHFYNWYDTRTLQPLPPAYISTVDSGNFLGCLVALKQGLKEKLGRAGAGPARSSTGWPTPSA